MPAAPVAKAHLSQYIVRSSDVLAEMRVNVLEEGTENVLWYKERVMTEAEIVESVMDSATDTIRWTVHRPKRGWYLRLRSPSFPPGTFIPLTPPILPSPTSQLSQTLELPSPVTTPTLSRSITDGSLTFFVRTAFPPPKVPSQRAPIDANVHSYPPTPPIAPSASASLTPTTPSPGELNSKLRILAPRSNVVRFALSPALPERAPLSPPSTSRALFSRAMTYLTPTLPIRATTSFTLAPITLPGEACIPLLTFTDRTSTFSVLTTGLLEVNKGLEYQMGVDPAFWIAVALAYLEFLGDRDSYLAAENG